LKKLNKIPFLFSVAFVMLFQYQVNSQNAAEPVVYYNFNDGSVTDITGKTSLSLRNGTAIFNDPVRGKVLRFQSAQKGYAVFNKQILNTDTCTFSFFFYWEQTGAMAWHQLVEAFNFKTGSNFFFCPANGWGGEASVLSDCRQYSSYEGVYSKSLAKGKWIHIALTIENKNTRIYIDGNLAAESQIMCTPSVISGDSLFLGGNPYRSDYYYITARLDEIKFFNQALAPNQITALAAETIIPEAQSESTSWETSGAPIELTIDLKNKKQTIQNFGASDGWNTEVIGKYWPLKKKEKLAELLFSTEKDETGNPKGIGLSSWRFNIGAGTAEQGDASRISTSSRRTEGFLNTDGTTYNWDKQAGQQWFLRKAALQYQVHHIIGWQNSPPVAFTKNNLGFREYNSTYETILRKDKFDDFGRFLADVANHFQNEGIEMDYISPLNEPQYPWSPESVGGTVSQEGTPWTNQDIYEVVNAINTEFSLRNVKTKLFITEAGAISHLLRGTGNAEDQLAKFWNSQSSYSLAGKSSIANIVSYHSYWNDYGNYMIDERKELLRRAALLNPVPELWQTEYSMMGTGYRSGYPSGYKLTEMECGLSLARIMMADLNIANTTGWQWWTTFEHGKFEGESRFCLIEAFTNNEKTDGIYHLNKLFYVFGSFSHFIRPGMTRIEISRSDNPSELTQSNTVNFSAYINKAENELVISAVNHTADGKPFSVELKNAGGKLVKNIAVYLTDDFNNLEKQNMEFTADNLVIPAHSVAIITAGIDFGTSATKIETGNERFKTWYNSPSDIIVVEPETGTTMESVFLYHISGIKVYEIHHVENQNTIQIPANSLSNGVFIISVKTKSGLSSKKVVVSKSH
jgi:O-glycosyl hydrolase